MKGISSTEITVVSADNGWIVTISNEPVDFNPMVNGMMGVMDKVVNRIHPPDELEKILQDNQISEDQIQPYPFRTVNVFHSFTEVLIFLDKWNITKLKNEKQQPR